MPWCVTHKVLSTFTLPLMLRYSQCSSSSVVQLIGRADALNARCYEYSTVKTQAWAELSASRLRAANPTLSQIRRASCQFTGQQTSKPVTTVQEFHNPTTVIEKRKLWHSKQQHPSVVPLLLQHPGCPSPDIQRPFWHIPLLV